MYHVTYTVTVDVKGLLVEAIVEEDEYNVIEKGNTVEVGYTNGYFDGKTYYNSVKHTIKYQGVEG